MGTEQSLRAFLHAPQSSQRFRLVLPDFGGSAKLNNAPAASNFFYRGATFAERDARAASHIQALLDLVVDAGNVTLAGASLGIEQQQEISFLFGSRSNSATQTLLQKLPNSLFQFNFSQSWSISCAGQSFSLPDPTVLEPTQYAAGDDYGVIARLHSPVQAPVFMIAGLGGRATEGCGLYFRDHWEDLNRSFGLQEFALVLRFPAPFELNHVEIAASSPHFAEAPASPWRSRSAG